MKQRIYYSWIVKSKLKNLVQRLKLELRLENLDESLDQRLGIITNTKKLNLRK